MKLLAIISAMLVSTSYGLDCTPGTTRQSGFIVLECYTSTLVWWWSFLVVHPLRLKRDDRGIFVVLTQVLSTTTTHPSTNCVARRTANR